MPANNQNKRAVYLLETEETGDYRETTRGGIYSTITKAAKAVTNEVNDFLKQIALEEAKRAITTLANVPSIDFRNTSPSKVYVTKETPPIVQKLCEDNSGTGWDEDLNRSDFKIVTTDDRSKYDIREGNTANVRFPTMVLNWQSVKRVMEADEYGGWCFCFEETSAFGDIYHLLAEKHYISITKEELQ